MSTNFRGLQERLRERLLAHINAGEMTGMELARRAGFQQAHISNFLNRKRGLSLEAMDGVLKVMRLTLDDLLREDAKRAARKRPAAAESREMLAVPLVTEENLTALQVPNFQGKTKVKIASKLVQALSAKMEIPRPHWDRFVAWRVTREDAEAMSPRLERDAIVVVDRHYNSLAPWKEERNIYLVRTEGAHVRYAEKADGKVVLRPHRPEAKLMWAEKEQIVGRVCLVQKVL